MIWLDVTKSGPDKPRSGLTRVTSRLAEELGAAATTCRWPDLATGRVAPAREDWHVTAEVFSAAERPGFEAFLEKRPCRLAAIYHDAIPLKHPHITWPKSVARHPAYLSELARLDRVFAVSEASRQELAAFWSWQGRSGTPPVGVLPLGADFRRGGRPGPGARPGGTPAPVLACVGILEPRKNQEMLLDVAEALWAEGLRFELHVAGRVNPHFGKPILRRIQSAVRQHPGRLHWSPSPSDEELARLYARAHATLFPSLAEGCGLPVLESLWHGVPCVCSDIPAVMENAVGGGCLSAEAGGRQVWIGAVRRILVEPHLRSTLAAAARDRRLPTWADAAQALRAGLAGPSQTITDGSESRP